MVSKLGNSIIIFFKGMLMGIADLVPGISGGTIAFITGVYEDLIEAINNINLNIFVNVQSLNISNIYVYSNLKIILKLFNHSISNYFYLIH